MLESVTVTGWWRKRLRKRASISVGLIALALLSEITAIYAPHYHHGIIRIPLISPLFVDVSLHRVNMYSECNYLAGLGEDNWTLRKCRDLIDEIDNTSLDQTMVRMCSIQNFLYIASGGVMCRTFAALRLASSIVLTLNYAAIFGNIVLLTASLMIVSMARDTFSKDRHFQDPSPEARLLESAYTERYEDNRLERLRDSYDRTSMSLASLRVAVRMGVVLIAIGHIWSCILYPLLGENIHMLSLPVVSSLLPSPNSTTLSIGYMTLAGACLMQVLASCIICGLLSEDLTAPLVDQKIYLANNKTGLRSRYDGRDDVIRLRDSIADLRQNNSVTLNDVIVHDEMIRLVNRDTDFPPP